MMTYQWSILHFHSSLKQSTKFVLVEKLVFIIKKSSSLLCIRSKLTLNLIQLIKVDCTNFIGALLQYLKVMKNYNCDRSDVIMFNTFLFVSCKGGNLAIKK